MKRTIILVMLMAIALLCGCSNSDLIEETNTVPTIVTEGITVATEAGTEAEHIEPTEESTIPQPTFVDLYSDENCLIQYYSVEDHKDYILVRFRITNYTDRTLTFQSDCISINGENADDLIMSDEIAPNSSGTASLKIEKFDREYFDFENISLISGSFRIVDFEDDDFYDGESSYEIKYINVPISNENEPCVLDVDEGKEIYSDDKVRLRSAHLVCIR